MAGFLHRHALRITVSLLIFSTAAGPAASETIEIDWVSEGNFIGSPAGGTLNGTFLSSQPFEFLPFSAPYDGRSGSTSAQMTLETTDGATLYVDTQVNFPQPFQIVNSGSGSFTFTGGTDVFTGATGGGTVEMTLTFPGPPPVSSGRVDTSLTGSITLTSEPLVGDFNGNGALDADDLDLLGAAAGSTESRFDLNSDGAVDFSDREFWVRQLGMTWFGDANLDGEFNTSDLINALAAGTYEADVDAGWTSGDFDGSRRFNSGDLILALADGGYEAGRRAVAVPELSTLATLLIGLVAIASVPSSRWKSS
jgi:hypothetical protein